MRRIMLGVLLAAGAMLPGIVTAQDRENRADGPRRHADRPDDGAYNGGRHREERAPATEPQPRVEMQAQVQQQPRPAPAGERPRDGDRFWRGNDGGQGFEYRRQQQAQAQLQAQQAQAQQQQAQQQQARQQQAQARDQRGYQQNGYAGRDQGYQRDRGYGNRGYGDRGRFDGPRVAPGSGGYRWQGGYNGGVGGPGYRPAPPQARGGAWNRGWRGDDRYDWGRYRAQNRGAFHLPRYDAPREWRYGYRRFTPGFSLSFELFDRSYWIDDAYAYRLPPAQWPYQWVRYYNDALLVDVRTGYVVDTVYDIFY